MADEDLKNAPQGWGKENYPYPEGAAFIECDEMKCTGCGICQMACSMKHHGVINKELARIQVRKYLLPLPKAVQATCVQCLVDEERKCEQACPLAPPAIHFDTTTLHMVIDTDRCLGKECLECRAACPVGAVRVYPSVSPKPFVCDLCDTQNTGDRRPVCVNACPCGALRFVDSRDIFYNISTPDVFQVNADEKAELIAKRLYPLTKYRIGYPGWDEIK
jgi:Fe-S-cluster-containing hydrogenase component 2